MKNRYWLLIMGLIILLGWYLPCAHQVQAVETEADNDILISEVAFSGELGIDFTDLTISGSQTDLVYDDPFNYDPDDDPYTENRDSLGLNLDLNVVLNQGLLNGNFDLTASQDNGGEYQLDELEGKIYTQNVLAVFGKDMEQTLRPYLFDGEYDEDEEEWEGPTIDGLIVRVNQEDQYLLHSRNVYYTDSDGEYTDKEGNLLPTDEDPVLKHRLYVFAGSNNFDWFNQKINLIYGVEKVTGQELTEGDGIVGASTTLNVGGFDFTPEFAIGDRNAADNYLTLKVEGDVGAVHTIYNYKDIEEGFQPIEATLEPTDGFDVELTSTILKNIDLLAYYESYDQGDVIYQPYTRVEMSVDQVTTSNDERETPLIIGGITFYGEVAHEIYNHLAEAKRDTFYLNGQKIYGNLTLTGELDYENSTTNFIDAAIAEDEDADPEDKFFNKTLSADYLIVPGLTAGAIYTWNLNDRLDDHRYLLDFIKGIFTVGLELTYDVDTTVEDDQEFMLYTGLNADKDASYQLKGINLIPYLDYKRWQEAGVINYKAGLDLEKVFYDVFTLTAGYEYADFEKDDTDDDHDFISTGSLTTARLSLAYQLTDTVKTTAGYKQLDFNGDTDNTDYQIDEIKAGVSVSF